MYLWALPILLSASLYVNATKYQKGDEVILYVNKVGPYVNPHETYHYYKLPVCRPRIVEHKGLTLGEVLDGDLLAKSLYKINYLENVSDEKLCELTLSSNEVSYLREAIEDKYYFEFVVDEIPIRDFIGYFEEEGFVHHVHKIFLSTHHHYQFYYNGNHIIYANLTQKHDPVNLDSVEDPLVLTPTYSVSWIKIGVTYAERDSLMQNTNFFPETLEVHWLSVLNSAILVFLLIGFVIVILTKVLRRDFARYNVDDGSESLEDEYGWKIIHTDVFRIPQHISLLSAILGVGVQFVTILVGIIVMALLGLFNVHRHGSMSSAAIFLYAFTSVVCGYVSGRFYRQAGGKRWVLNIHLTTILFAGPFFVIWSIENSVAWAYHSTQALPFTTVALVGLIWLLVGYPLTILGGIFGKNAQRDFNFPCRAKNFPREIPQTAWHKHAAAQYFIGGFLPFSSVSVEMYYIFSTVWGRDQYSLYGILGVVCVMLVSVVACVSITLTYFQLASEHHRWWWRSVFTCGSTSLFVLLYCVFYYVQRSSMSGALQTVQFIGSSLLAAYVFFLSLGTISFFSSFTFVRYIYTNIKMD